MIVFLVRDRDNPAYHTKYSNRKAGEFLTRQVQHRGVVYDMGGEMVELFSTSVMAEAIDRTVRSLLNYERAGKFPRPLFRIADSRRRLYSGAQVINCHRVALYRYHFVKNGQLAVEAFVSDIRQVFYSREIIVDTNGQIHPKPIQETA